MTQRTIKVSENGERIIIPLRGAKEPYANTANIAISEIRGASHWGTQGATISLVGTTSLDADLDEAGFAALLRVIVSEYEQRALTKDDVASVAFA